MFVLKQSILSDRSVPCLRCATTRRFRVAAELFEIHGHCLCIAGRNCSGPAAFRRWLRDFNLKRLDQREVVRFPGRNRPGRSFCLRHRLRHLTALKKRSIASRRILIHQHTKKMDAIHRMCPHGRTHFMDVDGGVSGRARRCSSIRLHQLGGDKIDGAIQGNQLVRGQIGGTIGPRRTGRSAMIPGRVAGYFIRVILGRQMIRG